MQFSLLQHIQGFVSVSTDLASRLEEISKVKHLEKGDFLHKPNRVCDTTYFIQSGLLRMYYEKGEKEITDNFASEGEWITSIYSFMRNIPDNFYIQCLENSQLIAIRLEDLERCFSDFHEMERFGRLLMSKYFLEHSERAAFFRFKSAKDKYFHFCKTSKNIISRVPLGMLASYLGITQETLSRIRADRGAF
jgi:CRP-like cAMP-binding protein